MSDLYIQPEYRLLLARAGLAGFDALFAAGEHEHVDGHLNRSVSRLRLSDPQGKTVVLYLKRRWGRAAGRAWADLLSRQWPMRPAAREWRNTWRLMEAGIPVAKPIAHGQDEGPHGSRSLLLFREVEGPSLAAYVHGLALGEEAPEQARLRKDVAIAVARAVRRLHDAGLALGDLYAKHLFLEGLGAPNMRVVFIDAQRMRRIGPWRRLRDLAALYSTTLEAGVRRTDRLRFLRTYLGQAHLGEAGRRLARWVTWLARRIVGRGRDPNLMRWHGLPARESWAGCPWHDGGLAVRLAAPAPSKAEAAAPAAPGRSPATPGRSPADEGFVLADHGRLRINRAFQAPLQDAGLVTLEAIMALEGGRPFRTVEGRSTVRLELAPAQGAPIAVYVKRHTRVPFWTGLRRAISWGEPVSLAWQEARAIARVAALGIPTVRIAAVGQDITHVGWGEKSCLITEEVPGAVQADDYCEKAFGRIRSRRARNQKRRLVRAMADLARRLHRGGLVHRDFYLCHILVRAVRGARPVLHLIDLERVGRRLGGAPPRWIVKDLAALLFSSWPSGATGIQSDVFTQTDRMRFACAYFGGRRLTAEQKGLVRRIVRKARWIARRQAGRLPRPDAGPQP